MKNMREVLEHELKDLYSAESQLVKALPKMAQGATEPQLQKAFEQHLLETQVHVTRLESIAEAAGISLHGKKCKGMEGLIAEGSDLLSEDEPSIIRDAALISAAQRIEHYEMAAYGSARTFAELLGQDQIVQVLNETLEEEKRADVLLTRIATSRVNNEAFRQGSDQYEAPMGDVSEITEDKSRSAAPTIDSRQL